MEAAGGWGGERVGTLCVTGGGAASCTQAMVKEEVNLRQESQPCAGTLRLLLLLLLLP